MCAFAKSSGQESRPRLHRRSTGTKVVRDEKEERRVDRFPPHPSVRMGRETVQTGGGTLACLHGRVLACQQRRLGPACRRCAESMRAASTAEHEADVRVGGPLSNLRGNGGPASAWRPWRCGSRRQGRCRHNTGRLHAGMKVPFYGGGGPTGTLDFIKDKPCARIHSLIARCVATGERITRDRWAVPSTCFCLDASVRDEIGCGTQIGTALQNTNRALRVAHSCRCECAAAGVPSACPGRTPWYGPLLE
jgi:hypothetical protein